MKIYNKRILVWSMLFLFAYVLTNVIVTPFMISWGNSTVLFKLVIIFFNEPFGWSSPVECQSLCSIVLNSLFWTLMFYSVLISIVKIRE